MSRFSALALATAFLLGSAVAGAESLNAQGPGAVFPSVEAAAIDALNFASEQKGSRLYERGGSIVPVAGGFTYAEPQRGNFDVMRLTLEPNAVAWYVARRDVRPSKRTRHDERLSYEARRMVDQVDPQKRPVFMLTPGKKILTYNDSRIARVDVPSAPVAAQDDR
jgi:hypothetical protein